MRLLLNGELVRHLRSNLLLKRHIFAPLSIIKVNIYSCPFHLFRSFKPLSFLLLSEQGRQGQIFYDEGTLKEGKNDTVELADFWQLTLLLSRLSLVFTLLFSPSITVANCAKDWYNKYDRTCYQNQRQ